MNVLIVEDNADDFLRIKKILCAEEEQDLPETEQSYHLVRATSREEAENLLLQRPNFFGLGILDIRLDEGDPNNQDGLLVARRILKSRKASFPVVMVTNHYDVEEYALEAEKMGIDLRYFLNKDSLRRNPTVFLKRVDDAVDNFGIREMSAVEYVAFKDRKVGIRGDRNNEYRFFGRDQILYLTTFEQTKTRIKMTDGTTFESSYNLGHFAPKIRSNFYNFLRIDQSYLINIELIKSIEGETLTFMNDEHIRLSRAALKRLRREHLII